jgi:hypothetical protein
MIKNIRKTRYGLEGEMTFHLFHQEIGVMMDEEVSEEYANLCADYLNTMSDELIDQLCKASIAYCVEFCEDVGEEVPQIDTFRDILKYIQPGSLIIDEPKDDRIVFHMELNCDWEIEHGLEWTITDGKVMYVGAFESEGGWYDEERYTDMSWNYAFR